MSKPSPNTDSDECHPGAWNERLAAMRTRSIGEPVGESIGELVGDLVGDLRKAS